MRMENVSNEISKGKPLRRTERMENLAKREGWRPTIHSPSGSKYTGNWHENTKHGVGEYISKKDWLFSGYFDTNRPVRYGVSAFGKGKNMYDIQYRGEWCDGHFHGRGILHFRDSSIYIGKFERSKRVGHGQMWYADGSYYEGDWHEGKRHGEGFFVEANGNRYEGTWLNGMKQGRGVFFHLHTGQYMSGLWVDDMCVSSIMADIPFRQTSIMPTEYTINEVLLDKAESVIEEALNNINKPHSESTGTLNETIYSPTQSLAKDPPKSSMFNKQI